MESTAHRAIAIVGAGAILPDAPTAPAFWENVKQGRYSISEVSPERWDPVLYYDPDPSAPDKTYSRIGGWVRRSSWDPIRWRMPIPPRVAEAMDEAQRWAIACTREALEDFGYPGHALNPDRTAVILGNAMAGEKHYLTALRAYIPEYARELAETVSFAALPEAVRRSICDDLRERIGHRLPAITEDSMPGELANCIAGRIANLYNFHGPNYVVDAACASSMAAINAAMQELVENKCDLAVSGGTDRNMGASTFIKFCKIGALSATGTRPYAEGADGFVMGEGCVIFLLKRLADAERDGDNIYAVVRGMGASSDGKGKGITAPNPLGQKLCIERAWENAGLPPDTVSMIEGHGTSTRVGDVVEVQSMAEVLAGCSLPAGSVALGSVKSNIGHLKGAAGAAGVLKTALSLRDKVLPPSVHCEHTNPDIDFAHSPLHVNTELKSWDVPADGVRRAGVSAFGFGGTNFHAVLEEYIPQRLTGESKRSVAVSFTPGTNREAVMNSSSTSGTLPVQLSHKAPLRGALVIGAESASELAQRLRTALPDMPTDANLHAPERLAIDYADAADLAEKREKALKALASDQSAVWKALRPQGVFRGHGPAPRVAFLYTGQGSQYVNMLQTLRNSEPIVAQTFAEADRVLTPLLGKPLTEYIFVDGTNSAAVARAEDDLRQTAITQPAVLATDIALTRLLAAYGIQPDMTMGHSLGEYGALVAAGALSFAEALEAVSARGREMTRVSMEDNGRMAAVFASPEEIERILATIDGYVVIANVNSNHQSVIGGASKAVEQAIEAFQKAGYNAMPLPVSHAFHTSIVAPASEPLRQMLRRLHLQSPRLPVVANVDGEFYPVGPDVKARMEDILARQVASPVQFVKGLQTLYAAGARVFVEAGPKKALQGFVEDVLGDRADVVSLFTNHPKNGDLAAFNQALCGLYAAGLGAGSGEAARPAEVVSVPGRETPGSDIAATAHAAVISNDQYTALGHMFAEVMERGWPIYRGGNGVGVQAPVAISGAALGLPGTEHVFDDGNIGRILKGEQFIDVIPARLRQAMLDKHITRLVKSDEHGPTFESISNVANVIKLAAREGELDIENEFGVSAERTAALDRVTALAIGVGIDALRDAGIPLVMHYKTTSKGTQLPEHWSLPKSLRDDTGVIFASAFPGYDSFAEEMAKYYEDRSRREQLAALEALHARATEANGNASILRLEIERRIEDLKAELAKQPYVFDRRFLFRVLAMGHSQFAEFIGARGPNTQVNAACASTTQAVAIAEDWIRAGRCRRVVVISADDVTSDHLLEWMGAGFLATGAAATDEAVEEAAVPFDRRRHGMIVGMGAAALVVESAEAVRERGIQPICEVLGAVTANSAFHGTRLDVEHISLIMEQVVSQAEKRGGISREQLAPQMVFVSHETYTPARGGSAAAEIHALRKVFGEAADRIVIANTKGFTGHPMGAGIEDVVAVKALETGCVPPVPNFKAVDPELGRLNLSKGGRYPVEYALRLGAGFGSQISMTLLRRSAAREAARPAPSALGYAQRIADKSVWEEWLARVADQTSPELEVVHRTLRVQEKARASQTPEPSPVVHPVSLQVETQAAAVSAAEVGAPSWQAPATEETSVAVVAEAVVEPEASAVAPLPSESTESVQDQSVKETVLAVVAEKTGYPTDMLDLDLDLEADLGIDTVKQAEVFASIRESFHIPRQENLKLRDFPTLGHVIRFVYDKRPDLAGVVVSAAVQSTEPTQLATVEAVSTSEAKAAAPAVTEIRETVLEIVAEKTGYPKDMLDLDLDLEADLGIDTVKQAEMFASVRAAYNIPRDQNLKLRDFPTLAHVIRFAQERSSASTVVAASSADTSSAETKKAIPETPQPTVTQSTLAAQAAGADSSATETNEVSQPAPAEAAKAAQVVAAEPAAPSAVTEDAIKEKVLEIVAEKTGYPKDMLDLDLDLEADLGIDTVKQAEMFASVRAAYNIPRDQNLKLRDFPTLAHVIKFAQDRVSINIGAAVAPSAPQSKDDALKSAPHAVARPEPASLDAANSIPRRVPVPVLRPPLEMCKPTGIELRQASRVIVMPDKGGMAESLATQLRQRGADVLVMDRATDADALTEQLNGWLAEGAVQGIYWLPALDREDTVERMDSATWQQAIRVRLKLLYTTMRVLYQQIASPGTFLISATRLGGQHGYDECGAVAPMGGAVAGFTKTYKRERNDALVKVVDFEAECSPVDVANALIAEMLQDPGAVEIGYKQGLRWTVGLQEQPAADGKPGMVLDSNTTFLVTGAAGSIVSAITADLASASGGTFYLLDLVPEPDPDNPDIKRFVSDKEALKRDLFARIQARGERATPALVDKELAALDRAQAARIAIDAVRSAGGQVFYFSVDLRDANAVAAVIRQVRERSGHIDVLLHAAGMERSHFLPDKEPREFDLVFDVKSDGWFDLLHAIGDLPLGATVVFSSIAGRFGNAGQTDYSAANDLLCKMTSSLRSTRPETRAIAVDWTAWGGIGMASRGSIPKMMELAGIDMLSPEAGIPLIRRELTAGGTRGEVVIGQCLGVLLNEWDASGGLEVADQKARGPMIGKLVSMGVHDGLTLETTLDPAVQPFLHDHQIEGTPVLPGVMGIEAFAEAASCILPGWNIEAVEDVNFLGPFKFYRNEPRTLTIKTNLYSQNGSVTADCRLIGLRQLPGQAEPQVTTHFTAHVRLTQARREGAVSLPVPTRSSGSVLEAADIYRVYFHGPAYRVLKRAWWEADSVIGEMAEHLPVAHQPSEAPLLISPRLIELCFQTAGLWEMVREHRFGLPLHVNRILAFAVPDAEKGSLYAVVTRHEQQGFNAKVVDSAGRCYLEMSGYRTVALSNDVNLEPFHALQVA